MAQYNQILEDVKKRALSAGRDPKNITVIAVSKYASLEEIRKAYAAGCRDFAESRVQEAIPKMESMPDDIRWHYIGKIQSNKIDIILGNFSLLHSVDSLELAQLIDQKSQKKKIVTPILLQVKFSHEETKQGFTPAGCKSALKNLKDLPGISIDGLMTMAPLTQDQDMIRDCFMQLRKLRDELGLSHLSMGMSQDYSLAIEEGATLLRIGSGIFSSNLLTSN